MRLSFGPNERVEQAGSLRCLNQNTRVEKTTIAHEFRFDRSASPGNDHDLRDDGTPQCFFLGHLRRLTFGDTREPADSGSSPWHRPSFELGSRAAQLLVD